MHLLDVKGVTKHFGGIKAIEDVSFKIKQESIVSIIGPNGAGKTTLFNCLTGLTALTRGRIAFMDADISKLPAHRILEAGIARTFQNIRLFPDMSVIENVMVAQHSTIKYGFASAVFRTPGFRKSELDAGQKAFEYLELAGIGSFAEQPANSLSYGNQRRLEIARALAAGPKLILLDEPTAGMNPSETAEVMKLIREIRGLGKTVVLIEHDMKLVMGISDRIVVLDHGVKISEGPPDEVRADPMVIEAYLGREALH
ncbi:MAG: ABC transporter ATP-binding protein [Nitrospirae bacterium]|nr:MAG: ABC transporter ATP-binding protein [Nitrospirota bacterium]